MACGLGQQPPLRHASSSAARGWRVKQFTQADVRGLGTKFPTIATDSYHEDLVWVPPKWMELGLTQTASGYGKRLNSGWMIHYNGRLYRVYATCFSNVASH